MVDPRKVTERLDRLALLLKQLERLRAGGRETYEDELQTSLAIERALQLAIQATIDIGAHLISELGLATPSDYHGVFTGLRPAGLDPELAERLGKAAGMRNVLVHEYLAVDPEKVWEALANLDDFRRFAAFVQEQLGREGPLTG